MKKISLFLSAALSVLTIDQSFAMEQQVYSYDSTGVKFARPMSQKDMQDYLAIGSNLKNQDPKRTRKIRNSVVKQEMQTIVNHVSQQPTQLAEFQNQNPETFKRIRNYVLREFTREDFTTSDLGISMQTSQQTPVNYVKSKLGQTCYTSDSMPYSEQSLETLVEFVRSQSGQQTPINSGGKSVSNVSMQEADTASDTQSNCPSTPIKVQQVFAEITPRTENVLACMGVKPDESGKIKFVTPDQKIRIYKDSKDRRRKGFELDRARSTDFLHSQKAFLYNQMQNGEYKVYENNCAKATEFLQTDEGKVLLKKVQEQTGVQELTGIPQQKQEYKEYIDKYGNRHVFGTHTPGMHVDEFSDNAPLATFGEPLEQ